MLAPDVAANIRAIFVHNGGPVAVDEAAKLLGWDIDTMDAAIKWNAVSLDTSSPAAPRISRRELLEHAFDQWSLADIKAALSPAEWRVLKQACGTSYGRLEVCDRDTLLAAAERRSGNVVDSAALLRPAVASAVRRRAQRERKATVIVPEQFKRRRRTDGVREFTLTAFEVRYRNLVPMLRLRGRWLARLGFKPGMRVYVVAQQGALLLTATDPAEMQEQAGAQPKVRARAASRLALAAPYHQIAGTLAVQDDAEG